MLLDPCQAPNATGAAGPVMLAIGKAQGDAQEGHNRCNTMSGLRCKLQLSRITCLSLHDASDIYFNYIHV